MRMPSRVMKIGIIGSGYVGTVTGAGLAELGNEVIFVDFDSDKVEALNRGEIAYLRTRAVGFTGEDEGPVSRNDGLQ